jgi:hypothetical protein
VEFIAGEIAASIAAKGDGDDTGRPLPRDFGVQPADKLSV